MEERMALILAVNKSPMSNTRMQKTGRVNKKASLIRRESLHWEKDIERHWWFESRPRLNPQASTPSIGCLIQYSGHQHSPLLTFTNQVMIVYSWLLVALTGRRRHLNTEKGFLKAGFCKFTRARVEKGVTCHCKFKRNFESLQMFDRLGLSPGHNYRISI